jgi:hypothetical protein
LINAAKKDAPKLKRYAASACGEKTVCENCAQDSVLVLMNTAVSGMSTISPR